MNKATTSCWIANKPSRQHPFSSSSSELTEKGEGREEEERWGGESSQEDRDQNVCFITDKN